MILDDQYLSHHHLTPPPGVESTVVQKSPPDGKGLHDLFFLRVEEDALTSDLN
jgi:hypothetical protein